MHFITTLNLTLKVRVYHIFWLAHNFALLAPSQGLGIVHPGHNDSYQTARIPPYLCYVATNRFPARHAIRSCYFPEFHVEVTLAQLHQAGIAALFGGVA